MPSSSRLRTWLQLLRAPNLFTVPGDPIAGFLISNAGFLDASLALAVVASLCFYAAGLLMNDLADEEEDRRERPQRPLPSGAAQARSVRLALWALNAAGLAALAFSGSRAALPAGAALVVAVWLYNRVTKRLAIVGALNMGLCRGLSVMLGALVGPMAAFGWKLAVLPALVVALYIAAVTNLARHETRAAVPVLARILPLLIGVAGSFGGARFALNSPDTSPAAVLFALFVAALVRLGWKLFPQPRPALPPLIGAHIRALLALQAAMCFAGAAQESGPWFAAALLALWPVAWLVGRRFYAS